MLEQPEIIPHMYVDRLSFPVSASASLEKMMSRLKNGYVQLPSS